MSRSHRRALSLAALVLALAWTAPLRAEVTPDQAAAMLLDSARRAYNEKNFPFAATRFREFLSRHGGHRDAPAARYGLALSLLEGPTRDYKTAQGELQQLAGHKNLPEHPWVLYYLGLCQRGQGVSSLAQARAHPPQAKQHRDTARQRFEEASKQLAAAAAAFGARAKGGLDARDLLLTREWAARARCDQAEMLLRLRQAREARATTAPFLEDETLRKSRYRGLGLYYHGFASFLLGDRLAAGRSLSMLAPFDNPVFGTHARYLLARVHQADGERQEAREHYEGVLADHAKQKQAATETLRQPDRLKNDPEEKERLQALVKGPAPDHVARATFFLGVLQYEDGHYDGALKHLADFAQQFPTSPLAAEAQLRRGFCQVQMKQFADALKTLQPLSHHETLADQALLWTARAQAGTADPARPETFRPALDTFRRAADRAQQRSGADPRARTRKGEILLALADTQQQARQYREAAGTYNQVLSEKLLPARGEEVLQHQVVALQLAGDYPESDKVCARFREAFPKSTLLPAVLFRHAENAYFQALKAEKLASAADRARETARWYDEAIKRYQEVEKYPEFAHVNLARYGAGTVYYRKGDLEKAREKLAAIPAAERTGDLAAVPYQLAEILIRQAPTRADDALTAGKLEEQLKEAVGLLEAFVTQPPGPHTADALLKLGHCQQRLAALLAQPEEKAKALAAARAAYEQITQKFPKDPAQPQAVFERARCLAQANQVDPAMNELRRFTASPLKDTPVAPLALLHLATLQRQRHRPTEAVDTLAKCRQQYEPALQKDPARAGWVPLLQYHHGLALKEAGKLAEARGLFDQVVRQSPDRPEAWEAALRAGQCLRDDAAKRLAEAGKRLDNPGLKAPDRAAAEKAVGDALKDLHEAARYLAAQADALKQKKPADEARQKTLDQVRARLLYEAAWACRTLADREVKTARARLVQERWQKQRDEAARKAAPGSPPAFVPRPDVALKEVPQQPAEKQTRTLYRALIEAFPEAALNADAPFELAELLSDRGEHDEAIKLLRDALDKEPPAELTDKIRVRLGAALQAKGDLKEALTQLQTVAANPKSTLLAQALYREGECLLRLNEPAEAVKKLSVFRDRGEFQNLPGLSDRALLRLGYALGQLKQWGPSRQAYEQVKNRFGNGPCVHEARYGAAWAWQHEGQYDQAVNAYGQVTGAVATRLGARAQLNIGLCRLAQKRYAEAGNALLVVPFTYDYPDLSALALVEAARAFAENKQPAQAARLLQRVLRDHADSEHAEAARARLEELKKAGG